jgi:frataxin
MTISEAEFHPLANEALDEIAQTIETHLDDRVDVEQQEGVLTIEMEDGGQYHINKHTPNRQIWLSSPKSGAWHFACSGAGASWVSTRDAGTTLGGLLRQEIGAATGVYIDLSL